MSQVLGVSFVLRKPRFQSLIPVVMAGIIAVYSLVIAVLIASDLEPPPGANYSLFKYVSIYIRKESKGYIK